MSTNIRTSATNDPGNTRSCYPVIACIFAVTCGLVLGGCGLFGSGEDDAIRISRSDLEHISLRQGIYREEIRAENTELVRISVSIPRISAGQTVPLVLALHYSPANFEGYVEPFYSEPFLSNLVEPGLRGLGAIIIAPDVPLGGNWLDVKSRDTVLDLIEAAKEVWPIDPDHVVVTGYSMGGIGAWYMADIAPDVFSAGIPIASKPIGDLSGEVPIYAIQGEKDTLFDLQELENAVLFMQENGATAQLIIAEGLGHLQAAAYAPHLAGAVLWLEEEIWQ